MRLHGRITVYGEYLMHDHACGLITSSSCWLGTDGGDDELHPDYDFAQDSVARALSKLDYPISKKPLYGTLPLASGFASSTALSYLHLGRLAPSCRIPAVANVIDQELHGFKPSGVDSGYYQRCRGGLFFHGRWSDVPDVALTWSCAILPKEREMSLPDVRSRILRRSSRLIALSRNMSVDVAAGRTIRPQLFEYATELYELMIYSHSAETLIERALSAGVVAKGIGGIYDKAVLLLHAPGNGGAIQAIRRQSCKELGATWLSA